MTYTLGVDLGTTYTAAAVARSGAGRGVPPPPEIVTLGNHDAAVPSVVYWPREGDVLVGEPAVRRAAVSPEATAREFKRRFGDATAIYLDGVPRTAQGLMATVLRWVVDRVVEREGGTPSGLAVTYPANWGDYRRELLQQAVAHVGLERAVFVTEPQAAALRYASTERIEAGGTVGVYDLGGGTFDAAVVRRTDDGFEMLGHPTGIEQLGGVDVDDIVFTHVVRALGGNAPTDDDMDDPAVAAAVLALRRECVEAKEALSDDTETLVAVNLPSVRTVVRMTRGELEELVRPLVLETVISFRRALDSAGVQPQGLTAVLLAGGASRMPLVAQTLSGELGRPVALDAHPKQVVALGAALWAASGGVLRAPAPAPAAHAAPAAPAAPAAQAGARIAAVPASRRAPEQPAAPPPAAPSRAPAARPRATSTSPAPAGPAAAAPAAPAAAAAPAPAVGAAGGASSAPGPSLRDTLAGAQTPAPGGRGGLLRRLAGQPDAVLLGGAAVCTGALLLVSFIGLPHPTPNRTLSVTQKGSDGNLDLAQETLEVSRGGAPLLAPSIRPKLLGIPLDASGAMGPTTASLSGHQYLLGGPVLANVDGAVLGADKQVRRVPSEEVIVRVGGGILTLPGIAGIALLMFAAAYAESLLRPVRKRGRARASTLAGMALVGAVLGIALALVGWALTDHLLTLSLLLVTALLGDAVALAGTVVLARRGEERAAARARPAPA